MSIDCVVRLDMYDDTRKWTLDKCLHSFTDIPSIQRQSGLHTWHDCGQLHREDNQPAIIWPGGGVRYYLHGDLIDWRDRRLP